MRTFTFEPFLWLELGRMGVPFSNPDYTGQKNNSAHILVFIRIMSCNSVLCTGSGGRPTRSIKTTELRTAHSALDGQNLCWSLMSSRDWNPLRHFFFFFWLLLVDLEQKTTVLFLGKHQLVRKRTRCGIKKEPSVCKQYLLQYNLNTCCAKLHEIARHILVARKCFVSSPTEKKEKSWAHYLAKICSHFLSWSCGSLFSWTGLWALVEATQCTFQEEGWGVVVVSGRHKLQHCIITVYIRTHML